MADWAEEICRLPLGLRGGGTALHLFGVALAHLDVGDDFLSDVRDCLREHDDLVDVWRGYSADKRTACGPYFGRSGFDLEVGFYDGGFLDVTRHGNAVDACADFIYREAAWILRHARVG